MRSWSRSQKQVNRRGLRKQRRWSRAKSRRNSAGRLWSLVTRRSVRDKQSWRSEVRSTKSVGRCPSSPPKSSSSGWIATVASTSSTAASRIGSMSSWTTTTSTSHKTTTSTSPRLLSLSCSSLSPTKAATRGTSSRASPHSSRTISSKTLLSRRQ